MPKVDVLKDMGFGSVFGSENDDFRNVFYALMSQDEDDLDEAIELVNDKQEEWPDDFRYELEGLRSFRQYYGRRMGDYTPEQRAMLHAYDETWTEDLVRRMIDPASMMTEEPAPEPSVN
ncbi:MAG TPA: hypothetical protein DCY07_05740 [Rhodospirillaceae bacterium]|nr:hypothetical protein [Rhodospirillaceae bacterium]